MERVSTKTVRKPRKAFSDDLNMKEVAPLSIWELNMAQRISKEEVGALRIQGWEGCELTNEESFSFRSHPSVIPTLWAMAPYIPPGSGSFPFFPSDRGLSTVKGLDGKRIEINRHEYN
jgi:hypothetical protein